MKSDSLILLDKLTQEGALREVTRSKLLLKDPEKVAEEWFFKVPNSFNEALDIRFNYSLATRGWSQSNTFSFRVNDVLYSNAIDGETWGESLKEGLISINIIRAIPSRSGKDGEKFAGSVSFRISVTNEANDGMYQLVELELSQYDFVKFLIEGPKGDLKNRVLNKIIS